MSKHKPAADDPQPGQPRRSPREQVQTRIAAEARRQRQQRLFWVVGVAVVLALVGGGIAIQQWRTSKAPDSAGPVTTASAAAGPAQLNAVSVPLEGKPLVLGRTDAPVTVTLYEDFHCPHCAEFEERFGPTLTAAQLAGKVKIDLYPMSFIDQGSARAANGMACAAAAGFPQTYYLGLFANPSLDWNADQLIKLADVTGTPATEDFRSCVSTGTYTSWATSVNTAANANGVTSTPTMFIDGTAVDIASLSTPADLQAKLDAAVGA